MNITADPGLPYTISHTYFTILNITKNKPFYLVQKPLYFEYKYKRWVIYHICPLTPLKILYSELYLQSLKLLELNIYKLLFCHSQFIPTSNYKFSDKWDDFKPIKWNRSLIEKLYPYLWPCSPVPPEIASNIIAHNTKRVNIQLSLFMHNFYL